MAPTTSRSAKLLSRIYGFESPENLAESLPRGAVVADIGAGRSKFGNRITELRSDITWMNIDLRYTTSNTHRRDTESASNLQFIAGDVFSLPVDRQSCDRIFCSALLPHIIIESPGLGARAIHNMAYLLKPNGILYLSRFVNSRVSIKPHRIEVITTQEYSRNPDEVVQKAVEKMTLPRLATSIQKVSNVLAHYSGINKLR